MTVSVLLDTVQSDKEDENYQLMNDSDMEFIAPEEIKIIDRNKTKKEEKSGKNTAVTWKRSISPNSRENCLLDGGVSYEFHKSVRAFGIYEEVINLDVLIELLVQQGNLYL